MYQAAAIQTCFNGLVGFNQPDDPQYPTIDTALLTSTSGKKLQAVHPLCTIENIVNVGPEFHNYVYPDWETGSNYNQRALVIDTDLVYRAKVALTNNTVAPHSDATNWEQIDPFSEWLKTVYNDACINLVSQYIIQRKLNEKSKSLLEIGEAYAGPGSLSNPIIGQSRFVGWEINLRNAAGLMQRLDKIGFQCTQPQDELIFYLYHSSLTQPIFEIPIEVADEASFSWTALTDKLIGYMQNGTSSQGVYFFGYYEADLEGQAIRKDVNLYRACQSCTRYDYEVWSEWSKYLDMRAIEVPASALQVDKTLFDTSKVQYVYDNNWGMNLSFAVMCDYTAVFCQNKAIFAEALAMQLALEFINKIAFSTRIGAIADQTKKLAMAELSTKEGSGSFVLEYYKVLQALDVDMSGLNRACLSCNTRTNIKWGSV